MNSDYRVYLLRIWSVGKQGREGVRIMLETPGTHETTGFSSLDELHQYLSRMESLAAENWKQAGKENRAG